MLPVTPPHPRAARTFLLLLALLLLGSLAPTRATAAEKVVGTGTPASCTEATLRGAVSGGGLVTFSCGGGPVTITLADELVITEDTEIDGGGPVQGGWVTLSGGGRTRVLATGGGAHLTVRNLTVAEGKEPGADGRGSAIRGGWRSPVTVVNSILRDNDGTAGAQEAGGGAIFVHETTLTVTDSRFVGNRGINGGAINNLLSSLTVTGSSFEQNDSTPGGPLRHGYGGAIYTDGASRATNDAVGGAIIIRDTVFRNNRGAGQGGAVFSFVYPPDTVTIERVTFEGNHLEENAKCYADGSCDSLGGALRHGNGDLTLSDTLFVSNSARGQGGAFWAGERGRWQLTNVTFAQNRAVRDAATGTGGLGGAIAGMSAWSCTNCTFVGNHAGFVGGAIFGGDPLTTTLQNSIFAGNTAFNDSRDWNKNQTCAAQLRDGGGNVQHPPRNTQDPSDVNCAAGATLADPLLMPLGDYGGPTRTVALREGSPARGAGLGCPAADQRGMSRPTSGCDSGAYQTGTIPVVVAVSPSMVERGADTTLVVTGADFAPGSEVLWNGAPLATTYGNPFQLVALLPVSRLGVETSGEVRVRSVGVTSMRVRTVRVVDSLTRVALPLLRRWTAGRWGG